MEKTKDLVKATTGSVPPSSLASISGVGLKPHAQGWSVSPQVLGIVEASSRTESICHQFETPLAAIRNSSLEEHPCPQRLMWSSLLRG